MMRIKGFFLGNWRNKVVALFFATGIWFVSYQSETRPYAAYLTVTLLPEDPSSTAIVGTAADDSSAGKGAFSGRVQVKFSGPRKEIDLLPERLRRQHRLTVPKDASSIEFRQELFGFPRESVSMVEFDPPRVEIQHEEVVELEVPNLHEYVDVIFQPGTEVLSEILKPDDNLLRVRVPKSLVGAFRPIINVARPGRDEPVRGFYSLGFESKQKTLLEETLQVWDWNSKIWVTAANAPNVEDRASLKEEQVNFDHPAVRVTFRVPLIDTAFKIELHDVAGDTIPVRFIGPGREITLLKNKLRDEPTFSLSVLVPNFDSEKGGTFTFSEGDLELTGFPQLRIEQHEDRRRELKTAWSYDIKVQ